MTTTLKRKLHRWLARHGVGPLQRRAATLIALVLAAVVAVMVVADLNASKVFIDREIETGTESTARMVALIASDELRTGDLATMTRAASELLRIGHLDRIAVYERATGLTLIAAAGSVAITHDAPDPLIRKVLDTRTPASGMRGLQIDVAVPFLIDDDFAGVALATSSNALQAERQQESIVRALGLAALMIAGLVPLTMVLLGRILRPIRELTLVARRIAAGEVEVPAIGRSRDEIGELARAFRRMSLKLRRSTEEERRLAYVDQVTGISSRERIYRTLEIVAQRTGNDRKPRGLFFIDLDGFKRVNDVLGHDCGDRLLASVARRFEAVCREQGYRLSDPLELPFNNNSVGRFARLGRLGGDEFVITAAFLEDNTEEAKRLADALARALDEPFRLEGQEVRVGASVGIARMPEDGTDARTLMRCADLAMYDAKERGGNRYSFFSDELSQRMLDRLLVEMQLRRGIGTGEIEVAYMPQVRFSDRAVIGFEALARWRHPTKGIADPSLFIPIAEETGVIVDIDRLVMTEAVRQAAHWHARGLSLPVSVNVSASHMERPDFVPFIERLILGAGIPGELLEIEITESTAMRDPERVSVDMRQLHALGVRFAIDDFGTGYSNLAQLQRLPVDVFKIDRSLTRNVAQDKEAELLVCTIVALAKQLGLRTVAEGIEDEEQAALLGKLGCDVGQGYLFGRPAPLAEAETLLPRGSAHAGQQRA